jgi:MoaA/NifB/PqqE/SkfB family radical SAM enzyme
VGISLDGIGEINDKLRQGGAFDKAMEGFRNCKAVEQRVGLRLTLTRHNYKDLHRIFDFIEAENIDRACFYHLVYSGRGKESDDLTHEESRDALDIILDRTKDMHDRGLEKDILTVDNHVDGIYLYMRLLKEDPERAVEVMKLLEWNGGGMAIRRRQRHRFLGNHADQFWIPRFR